MNRKTTFIILIIYGLLIAGLVTRNGSVILLALPFLVYLVTGILAAPAEPRISVSRTINHSITESDSPVEVKLILENEAASLAKLHLDDRDFPGLQILEGYREQSMALPAGSKAEISYKFEARRGNYRWDSISIVASDPFGMFEKALTIPAEGQLLIFPERKKIKHLSLKPLRMLQTSGPFPARRAGSGIDFWGIRDYRAGDPLRWIHWGLTARHPGKFFVKEFERQEIADIGLILDAQIRNDLLSVEKSLSEYSIQVTASLAEAFLREGNRVGLLTLDSGVRYLFPGGGKGQLQNILLHLACSKNGSSISLDKLDFLPVRLFPSRSLIIVISPLGSRDIQAFYRLRAHGYQLLLISPDPVAFAAQNLPVDRLNQLAVRAAHLERNLQLSQLKQLGVEVIEWQVDQPLLNTINTALLARRAFR